MAKNELKQKELAMDEQVKFIWKTDNYGRAEFTICPIMKRGKIRECYIYPRQQPDAKNYFVVKNEFGWSGLDFGSLLHNNRLFDPKVWVTHYCKEHKCHSFKMYVPENSSSLAITTALGRISFDWR